jgi:hypothetical protein
MPIYEQIRTTAVTGDTEILASVDSVAGASYVIFAYNSALWVNVKGGAATVEGDDCLPIPQDGWDTIVLHDQQAINAIQDTGGVNAHATVARVKP